MKLSLLRLAKVYYRWALNNDERIAILNNKYNEVIQEVLNNNGNAVLSGAMGDSSFTYSLTDSYSAAELALVLETALDWIENGVTRASSVNVSFRR